jgi:TP901 family phage tail tape measure protein
MPLNKGSLGSLLVKIEADLSNLDKGLTRANNMVEGKTRTINAALASVARVAAGVGIAIGAGLLYAGKQAVDFEDAFVGVRKTVDATEAEFAQLSDNLLQLSRNIPKTAVELANIQAIAGQLGVRGVETLTKFTEVIAGISVATNLTQEAAATAFARIANVMEEPLENIEQMASSVVDLGNTTATTEAEITNFANRIAGAGKVAGLTTADLFGIAAAFTSVGVRAERGGTAVQRALIELGSAVAEGGSKLEEFAAISGMTSEEFSKMFAEDAAKAFALFIEGLGKQGLRGAQILERLQLGNQRTVQAFLSVGGATGILTEKVKQANDAFEENTALQEEVNKKYSAGAARIQMMKNNVNFLAITIGNKLLPVLEKALQLINAYVDSVSNIPIKSELELLEESYAGLNEQINIRKKLLGEMTGQSAVMAAGIAQEIEKLTEERDILALLIEKEKERNRLQAERAEQKATEIDEPTAKSLEEESQDEGFVFDPLEKFREYQNELRLLSEAELQRRLNALQNEMTQTKSIEEQKTTAIKKEIFARIKLRKLEDQITANSFDLLEAMVNSFAGESKAAAIAVKVIRAGEVLINGMKAISEIEAAWAWNPPVAAALVSKQKISTALQLATIAATSFQSGSDDVPFRGLTDPGEIVVPRSFAQAIREGRLTLGGPEGRSSGQGTQIMIEQITINSQSETPEELIDDIIEQSMEQISKEIDNLSRGAA